MSTTDIRPLTTEPEVFKPSQIYNLYDARARDYRTILIAIVALLGGLFVGMVNALGDDKPGFVPATFLGVMAVLAGIAWWRVRPELRAVREHAEHIRTRYCVNAKLVPVIDAALVGNKHRDRLPAQNANVAEPDTPSDLPLA